MVSAVSSGICFIIWLGLEYSAFTSLPRELQTNNENEVQCVPLIAFPPTLRDESCHMPISYIPNEEGQSVRM